MAIDALPSWRETPAKQSIVEFVAAVTNPDSETFVPEVDRVAVFDNDGTLSTEMPMYTQLAFALDRAAELGKPTSLDELKAGGLGAVVELLKLTHGSITTDEFTAVCRKWIASAHHPRFGRSYSAMVYQPMLELLSLLGSNGFSCWIFSGGGADFMRTWAPEVLGLPPHRVFGSLGATEFRIGDAGPELVKGTDIQLLDDGPAEADLDPSARRAAPDSRRGKHQRRPADAPVDRRQPGRTLQLVVHHTDAEREYAYDLDPLLGAGTDQLLGAASDGKWTVIDMAADWATIYSQEP